MKKEKITEMEAPPVVSGNKLADWKLFIQCKDYDFGVRLLERYVPHNRPLIDHCRAHRDATYLKLNLKAILL